VDTKEMTHTYRLNQWTELIRECSSSGKTIKSWCTENSIRDSAYYYWLKKVRTVACESLPKLDPRSNQIIQVKIPDCTEIESQVSPSNIILHFGSVTLELHNGASTTLIENTLRALQNVR